MSKKIQYAAMIFALALAVSCNKIEDKTSGEAQIRFSPESVETKAMINDAAGLQSQTFKVWDYMGTTAYIDDEVSFANNTWNYPEDHVYVWKDGSHKLFGYTKGAGTWANNKLAVSKKLTTDNDDQVDLLYSKVFATTAEAWKAIDGNKWNTPVPMHLKHLFSAVSFTVKNATTSAVVLNSVSVSIPNSGSATVDYSGDEVSVTYGEVSVDGSFISATPLSNLTVASNGLVDVLGQAAGDGAYMMVWPQTFAEGELTVNVRYTMNDQSYNKDVKIPAVTWAAGNKYGYVLQILPTEVRLVFEVQPWEKVNVGTIDTKDGSINMSNVTWQNTKVKLTEDGAVTNTLFINQYSVFMYKDAYVRMINEETGAEYYELYEGYYPAQGYFTVNYPLTGQFKMDLIPAYGETTVDKSKYEIWIYDETVTPHIFRPINDAENLADWRDAQGINTIYFQVRAAEGLAEPHPEYKAQINIWIRQGSGDWISAYSEIRANYACIIPAVTESNNG